MVASGALCLALGAAWYGGSVEAGAGWPDLSTPPAATGGGEQDAAVVIAIEDYAFLPDVKGAGQNGKDWYLYLSQTRKVPMVKFLKNNEGAREGILAAVKAARGQVQSGGKLWVVFIGHGAPAKDGQDGLLVGVDAQQTAVSIFPRSVGLKEIEAAAGGVPVLAVLDACFSGKAAGGMLAEDLQPTIPVYAVGGGMTVLAAGKGDQFAGPLNGAARPAFSYLLLGAMRGWGDSDGDGRVTAGEAVGYADRALVQTVNGREQRPELKGEAGLVIGAGRERGPDLARLTLEMNGGRVEVVEEQGEKVWTAADAVVLSSMVQAEREEQLRPVRAEQAAERERLVQARQEAVAAEWAMLRQAFGAPEGVLAAGVAAVRQKREEWARDTVTVATRRVTLSGVAEWKGREERVSGTEELKGETVAVEHSATLRQVDAWLASAAAPRAEGPDVRPLRIDTSAQTVRRAEGPGNIAPWVVAGAGVLVSAGFFAEGWSVEAGMDGSGTRAVLEDQQAQANLFYALGYGSLAAGATSGVVGLIVSPLSGGAHVGWRVAW